MTSGTIHAGMKAYIGSMTRDEWTLAYALYKDHVDQDAVAAEAATCARAAQ